MIQKTTFLKGCFPYSAIHAENGSLYPIYILYSNLWNYLWDK